MSLNVTVSNSIRTSWPKPQVGAGVFAIVLIACATLSALLASWLPLQASIVTVFLFAGPHNWFEFRYFLMRLPIKLGQSRNFFLTAFLGIAVLTACYLALPFLYNWTALTPGAWINILATWNTLLLLWIGALVWLRGKHRQRRDWSWAIPLALGISAVNWLQPEFFSLAIVYLHPLIALWFLDRHLRTTRREWLPVYHRCLALLPLLLVGIIWAQATAPELGNDNGLFWRITQHAGAELLPNIPSRILVSVHLFLEMLHYGVWIVALPLIAPLTRPAIETGNEVRGLRRVSIWKVSSVPLARHSRGFPKLVGVALCLGIFVVVILWVGFSMDYATTRDIYFTVAIAHVVAEAPFLLKML
ncbi:MAG TPA: hypothetical protein VNO50_15570 [Pyrinomonadaceae bacterium]|nr:hypothetical protein [Pyrinomonadaceae bacterium]